MKALILLLLSISFIVQKSFGQNIAASDLVGTWDQNVMSRAATIIFDDASRVRFSYKGRSGSTRKYYYLLDNLQIPVTLTVYYRANHKRQRNKYLLELTDKNTMKLQVVRKKGTALHFDETRKDKIITLNRRRD
ncbi:MAG: hypothetical protein JST47_00465 [Bacteroidetes bacterium]|nr:hypothetical protein [Bacteroidota bacterium]MBS1972819.1 hypothetical protein [Bacteroidota bacterium]